MRKLQLKAFDSTPHGTRKVVIATNIAEASVTIPGIAYGKRKRSNMTAWKSHLSISFFLCIISIKSYYSTIERHVFVLYKELPSYSHFVMSQMKWFVNFKWSIVDTWNCGRWIRRTASRRSWRWPFHRPLQSSERAEPAESDPERLIDCIQVGGIDCLDKKNFGSGLLFCWKFDK